MAVNEEHEMIDRLARIETKLDIYLDKTDGLDKRVVALEQAKGKLIGFTAALGLLGGGTGGVLYKLLGG